MRPVLQRRARVVANEINPPDNAFKSDKWDSECEDYWRARIIHKPEYHEIFNPFQQ